MQVKVLVYLDYYRMDGVVYWTTKEEKGIAQVSFIKRTPSGEKKNNSLLYMNEQKQILSSYLIWTEGVGLIKKYQV
jgi:hypothetical protein